MVTTTVQRKKPAPVARLGLRETAQSPESFRSGSDIVLSAGGVPADTSTAEKQYVGTSGGSGAARALRKPSTDEIDRSLAVFAARKDFVVTTVNMGWQLAVTVLVPLLIGVKLDSYFNTQPSYTLAALFIAIGMAVMVVARTIKQVAVRSGKRS